MLLQKFIMAINTRERGVLKLPKLTAISTALLPNRTKLQIFPYYFNAFHFVSGFGANEMFESRMAELIDSKIQIYDAQLGYPSGLTSEVVIEHLWDATMAFHMLRDLRKRMNAAEVTDSHGISVGWAFSSKITAKAGADGPNYYNFLPSIKWSQNPTDQYNIVEVPRVSNKEWAELIGRAEGLIMLPKTWAAIISYYADNYFSLNSRDDDGHTQFINFQTPTFDPKRNSSWDNDYLMINAYLEDMNDRFIENPTLRLFLASHMNIDRIINQFDFDRDVSSRTLSIVDDSNILDALETTLNVHFDGCTFEDDYLTEREVMYTPDDVYMSPLDHDDFIEIDTDSILEKLLLATYYDGDEPLGTYIPPILSSYVTVDAYKKDSEFPLVYSIPPGTLKFAGTESMITTGTVTFAMEVFPLDVPFRPTYTMASSADRRINAEIGIKQGFNLYSVNEDDFLTVKLDKCLSLLFDGVPFKLSYPNPILYDKEVGLVKPDKSVTKKDSSDRKKGKKNNKGNNNKNKDKK